jgi:hypothetical protein
MNTFCSHSNAPMSCEPGYDAGARISHTPACSEHRTTGSLCRDCLTEKLEPPSTKVGPLKDGPEPTGLRSALLRTSPHRKVSDYRLLLDSDAKYNSFEQLSVAALPENPIDVPISQLFISWVVGVGSAIVPPQSISGLIATRVPKRGVA